MPEPLAPLVDELPTGVLHAALPTPFAVGPVNCYLLADTPVTIVDPGMITHESLAMVDELLASAGLSVADIDQIVVTHGHPDHFGAAARLAREGDARILTGAAERRKLCMETDRLTNYTAVLADLGLPEEARDLFPALMSSIGGLVEPAAPEMIDTLADGDRLSAGGGHWMVQVTPGHAAGHASLFDGRTLISGDHLLPRISPNPFLEITEGDAPARRRSLVEYLESLDRFCVLDPKVVLPGHGEAFTDVPAWAGRIRAHHERRSDEIRRVLAAYPGATAYELTRLVFPQLDGFEIMLGISEIAGHLDVLANIGAAHTYGERPQRWYPT
jgi:glyoxylase-like metal-dependent hydrolase (beta-lactamase superfamily II)